MRRTLRSKSRSRAKPKKQVSIQPRGASETWRFPFDFWHDEMEVIKMPKLKKTPQEEADLRLREAIAGSSTYLGLSIQAQAEVAGVGRSTWYRRLDHPGDFTLSEFRRMCRKYRWTEEQVLRIVRV